MRRSEAKRYAKERALERRKIPPLDIKIGFATARALDRYLTRMAHQAGKEFEAAPVVVVHIPGWGIDRLPRPLFNAECRGLLGG